MDQLNIRFDVNIAEEHTLLEFVFYVLKVIYHTHTTHNN